MIVVEFLVVCHLDTIASDVSLLSFENDPNATVAIGNPVAFHLTFALKFRYANVSVTHS